MKVQKGLSCYSIIMKKNVLFLLSLIIGATMFFTACNGKDDPTPPEPPVPPTIDEAILGKWKVEYCKMIHPGYMDEEWNVTYRDDSRIREYFGDFDQTGEKFGFGMFDNNEVWIEIRKDNKVRSYSTAVDFKYPKYTTFDYEVRNGFLHFDFGFGEQTMRYYFDKKGYLIIERKPVSPFFYYYYSRYSKIE